MTNFVLARNSRGEILHDVGAFDEVPDKYLPLLCSFVEELEPLVEGLGEAAEDFYFLQVKEKYGELRFYPSFSTDEIDELIEAYTELSRAVK